jgi:hypothetical protein
MNALIHQIGMEKGTQTRWEIKQGGAVFNRTPGFEWNPEGGHALQSITVEARG